MTDPVNKTPHPLTKGERRFLSRHTCWLCNHRLDRGGCSSIYERCSDEWLTKRRTAMLATYKPRKVPA